MSRVAIPVKEQKLVWGFAAARCNKPECRILCVARAQGQDPNVTIGEIAHIHSYSDDGPRPNTSLSIDDRNSYANLLLLCANHHTEVDGQESTYSVDILREWKRTHELWVEQRLQSSISNVSFAELDMVTKGIIAIPVPPTDNFTIISPTEKISKNLLSTKIAQRIRLGIVKAKEVEEFVRDASKVVTDFPERISQGFVAKYRELHDAGLRGDSLFEGMHEFACNGHTDFDHQSAGLAVLVYLFEKCEVFEK